MQKLFFCLLMLLFLSITSIAQTQVLEKVSSFTDANLSQRGNEFVEYKGKLYFTLIDTTSGYSFGLWVTDGTDTGTHVFYKKVSNDLFTPKYLKVFNGKLFFVAWEVSYGFQMWVTDGNQDSTKVLFRDYPSASGLGITDYAIINNTLYYSIEGGAIWGTDGTTNGTFRLTQNVGNAGLIAFNNELYFSSYDSFGTELRKSNGSPLNISLVKNINVTGSSSPLTIGIVNNKLIFIANDSIHGDEYWATDGTDTGTYLIKDCNPKGDLMPNKEYHNITNGNKFFFCAQSSDTLLYYPSFSNKVKLWVSDGTSQNTLLYDSVELESAGSFYDYNFHIIKNRLYFLKINSGSSLRTDSIS